ncbi:MAG: MBOAT family protein [Verrucomicrobia bacterium]|nr:MBOAT family protein [Verrucomicrobiota bacterium]
MLFNTIEFGIFFLAVLSLYFVLPHRGQNLMLLGASYLFYGAWDYRFLSLILISTTVDFVVGQMLHKSEDDRRRKVILFWSIFINLGFLGFFKYCNFFAENLQGLLATFGVQVRPSTLSIILPVGISFYTFQSMSYTIDIYRRQLKPCTRFFDFMLYVAFFPQLVAGPIERAQHLLRQVTTPRKVRKEHFTEGFHLIMWGLFKKMVIADNMALIADPIFNQSGDFSAGQVFVGALAFAFQIYGDFSGYTDIARGVARTMGFELMLNFNLPYFATSPQDFWRRWHISLSTWLRDYLYIPLGGSKKGEVRTYINLMLTMVLGGLWHGASWTFVIWGFYHGALLCVHRLIQKSLPVPSFSPAGEFVWRWTRIAFMFGLTLYGWLIFRAASFEQLMAMTKALFAFQLSPETVGLVVKILFYCGLLLLVQLYQHARNNLEAVRESPVLLQTSFYLVCFYLIAIFGVFDAQSFIYFQF